MENDIDAYHGKLDVMSGKICHRLHALINGGLADAGSKVWHGHPVWFLDGNPIVGYSVQKQGVRLIFWSGESFDEPGLNVVGEKFHDASVFYSSVDDINTNDIERWLQKSRNIQWDYKNIVKRRGKLEKLTSF